MSINGCRYSALAASVLLLAGETHAQRQSPENDPSDGAAEPLSGEHSTQEAPRAPEEQARADADGDDADADARDDADEDATGDADDDDAVRVEPRVEDTDPDVANVVRADREDIDSAEAAARRDELRAMADETVVRLERSDEVSVGIEDAHGYAVFDIAGEGLIVPGAGGSGVATRNDTGEETFMHLGGVGAGARLESYKLVLVFEDVAAYEEFVDGRWDTGAAARAAAGEENGSDQRRVLEDVEAYRLVEGGPVTGADVTGMRFRPSEALNPPRG